MEYFFPYDDYRRMQLNFMDSVYSTLENKSKLLVHAPTGTGKTVSVLAPALTYVMKEDPKKVIFFLTSRNTQHLIAVNTLREIKKKYGLGFVVVDLIGKKGMCNQDGVSLLSSGEFAEYCKDLREKGNCDFYKNLKTKNKVSVEAENVLNKLKIESPLHVEEMNSICFNSDLCSYEMACLLGKKAQVIIADYNYLINPHIRANLLTRIGKTLHDCILIFDEGHNIPSRARDMLSSNLNNFILDYAARETKRIGYEEMAKDLVSMNDSVLHMAKKKVPLAKNETLVIKQDFFDLVESIGNYEELMGNFAFVADQVLEKKRRSFAQSVSHFMENWIGPDEGFVRILSKEFVKGGRVKTGLSHRCLDPGLVFDDLRKEAHAIIVMSGTLTPLDMYADLLGLKKSVKLEYQNPFPQENRLNIIVPETTTKYSKRNKFMFEKIAEKCAEVVNNIPGNSVVFFPSYKLRDDIYEFFVEKVDKTILLEDPSYSKEQRGELLEEFKTYKNDGAILLAVAGGSFAEGIDFPGDLLKGVVVVGLPLAMPDLETKELINYYDTRFGKGWDYGYVFPAIIKILQSAGRCIRSETDRGVIVFLGERYLWQSYRNCFPKELNMRISRNPGSLVKDFFN